MAKKDPKLTPRQEAFVRAYCTAGSAGLFNATEAAIQAGYKGNRQTLSTVGHDNLRKPYLARAIRARINELYASYDITTDRVLNDIEFTRQQALADGNWTVALRASELHGKYLTMFTERIEHIHTLEETPMEELDRLASTLLEKVYGLSLPGDAGTDGAEGGVDSGAEGDRTTH